MARKQANSSTVAKNLKIDPKLLEKAKIALDAASESDAVRKAFQIVLFLHERGAFKSGETTIGLSVDFVNADGNIERCLFI